MQQNLTTLIYAYIQIQNCQLEDHFAVCIYESNVWKPEKEYLTKK